MKEIFTRSRLFPTITAQFKTQCRLYRRNVKNIFRGNTLRKLSESIDATFVWNKHRYRNTEFSKSTKTPLGSPRRRLFSYGYDFDEYMFIIFFFSKPLFVFENHGVTVWREDTRVACAYLHTRAYDAKLFENIMLAKNSLMRRVCKNKYSQGRGQCNRRRLRRFFFFFSPFRPKSNRHNTIFAAKIKVCPAPIEFAF